MLLKIYKNSSNRGPGNPEHFPGEYLLLRTLVDLLPDRIYMKDLESRFVLCNKATAYHAGVEDSDLLIGKMDSDFYGKESADKYYADEQRLIKTGKPFIYINERNLDKAGNEKWSLTTKMPLRDKGGEIIGLIGIGRDITDLKESEKYITQKYFSLQSNKSFNFKNILQNIIENSTDSICIKDLEGRYILLNKNHSDWLGASDPQEVMGKKDSDFLPLAQAEQIRKDELRIFYTQKPITYEEKRKGPDGKNKWILTRKYPFYDDENRIIGVFALSRDITHYKHLEKTLRKVNKQKTQFFINLAHETKTPLTLIRNYLDNYINKYGLNDDLQVISNSIRKLLSDMINYLDEEKLRRKQVFYNHKRLINASELLIDKIPLLKEIAEENKLKFKADIEERVLLRADPLAVDRIINNLIDNSVKYTDKGGEIRVALKVVKEKVVFEVTDTGIGMNEEQMACIFKPYYQLSHEKGTHQGIGMGLNIVKSIVDSLHGQIKVESIPGKGSTFTILFKKPVTQKNEEIMKEVIPAYPYSRKQVIKDIKEQDLGAGKPNILLVDDNMDMLYFLQTSLKAKYNVYLARSGEEALQKLKTMPVPDIIISDIMMGGIDGHQFFLCLKDTTEYRSVPFIFLSAKTVDEEKIKGLMEGAMDYIYKPFLIEEVAAKIQNIIKKRQEQREKDIKEMEEKIAALSKADRSQRTEADFMALCSEKNITKREIEVLSLLLKGMYNKEIGNALKIKLITVEKHIQHIFQKTGARNRYELLNIFR